MTRNACGMLSGLLLCIGTGWAEDWQHPPSPVPQDIPLPAGPFQPMWSSLEKYQAPEWFCDLQFGLFVHWGPQTFAGVSGSADGRLSPWKELAATKYEIDTAKH